MISSNYGRVLLGTEILFKDIALMFKSWIIDIYGEKKPIIYFYMINGTIIEYKNFKSEQDCTEFFTSTYNLWQNWQEDQKRKNIDG